jgi:glutaredoxin
MRRVTFYGRAGCHLCDDAMTVVQRVRREQAFSLEIVDIESDDELLMRYLERIPVVAVDGDELFQFFVDEPALVRAVANLSPPLCGPSN